MTKRQRVVITGLALLVLAMPLYATGTQEPAMAGAMAEVNRTGWPIVDEPVTVEMMGVRASNQADWNDMLIWDWYEDLTNVHVDWTTIDSDGRDEKRQLIFASGDYPEAFYGMYITAQEEIIYGSQGVLIPLEGLYEEYSPNIMAYLDSDPEIRKTYTAPDGHIYTFPSGTDRTVFLNAYTMINVQWLEEVGLDMPETIDDFYEVLQAFKTEDPNGNGKADEIPLAVSIRADTDDFWNLLQWFGISCDRRTRVFGETDGTVTYVPTDDRTLEGLRWFNKLWEEGLLDPETFTQTWREIDAKGQDEEANVLGAYKRSTIAWTSGFERFPQYEIMPALENHLGSEMVCGKYVISKGRFSMTSASEHSEVLARWIDYFATVEGAMNIQMGPEGTYWEWADAAHSGFVKLNPDVQSTAEIVTPKNGTHVPFINFDWITRNRVLQEGEIDWQAKVYDGIDEGLHPYRHLFFPDAYMTVDQVNAAAPIQSDIDPYVDQMIARFIVGDEPFSNWDTYVSTVNRMGADRLLAIYQEVYDSYNQ